MGDGFGLKEVIIVAQKVIGLSKQNKEIPKPEIADYWGLAVEVILRMEHCSLVRFRDHEFVVNTQDLQERLSVRCAA